MIAAILGLLHIIIFIWALFKILGSSLGPGGKILWILAVLLFPIVGLIAYLLIGQKN
jgi:hypothetical protein